MTLSRKSLLVPYSQRHPSSHFSDNTTRHTIMRVNQSNYLTTKICFSFQRLQDSVEAMMKSKNRHEKFNFTNYYQITQAQVVPLQLDPNPTEILHSICDSLLVKNVSTILYMTNSENWGSNAVSAQYLLQLTSYLGIPVIAWNADNIGLDQVI